MFITFEGCEASGKSTQCAILRDFFIRNGKDNKDVICTKEPGGTILADKIRNILLEDEIIDPMTEFLLLSAARRDHVTQIRKDIFAGKILISDRFSDSSIAYQGYYKGLDIDFILETTKYITQDLQPNITFLLDVEVKTAVDRMKISNKHNNFYDEKGIDFHQKIKNGFLKIAEQEANKKRIVIIDANQDEIHVSKQIIAELYSRKLI